MGEAGSSFATLGGWIAEAIIGVSDGLREDHAPGVVAFVLIVGLIGFCLDLGIRVFTRRAALGWLTRKFVETVNEANFSDQVDELTREIRDAKRRGPRSRVADAWDEYRETFVSDRVDDRTMQRNTVRPSVFFNLEDLDFGPGYWRILPGLFVTVGLFLTFLGLISALHSMNTAEGISDEAMSNLLAVASAKFIMSLTGLACSILFTLALRVAMRVVEGAIHRLNRTLEQRLSFISLEQKAVEQLAAIQEQRDHFRSIGMDLVAELARPLREEVPETISRSIGEAIGPVVEKVSQLGTDGVNDMVQDLSSRFSQDVDGVLGRASDRLAEAGDRIGQLVDRMDQNSGEMGTTMKDAVARLDETVEQLRNTLTTGATEATTAFGEGVESILAAMNDTLTGIRENTREGADAIGEAAREMRTAAETIRSELEAAARDGAAAATGRMATAGEEVTRAIGTAGAEIFRTTEKAAAQARQELLDPLQSIGTQIEAMVQSLAQGAAGMQRLSESVRVSADSTTAASGRFRDAAGVLVDATAPVRVTTEQLRDATERLANSTHHVAESTRATADGMRQALDAAQEALGGQRRAVETTMEGLQRALADLRRQGERLDELDTKLGDAFKDFAEQVDAAVGGLFGHVRTMQGMLTPAVEKMRDVVDLAERFVPESRRR